MENLFLLEMIFSLLLMYRNIIWNTKRFAMLRQNETNLLCV